jgi:hypothetical protein
VRRRSASLAGEYRVAEDVTITAGGGVTFVGDITVDGVRHDLGTGPLGFAGAAYRILDGDDWEPFLLFAAAFSTSTASSQSSVDQSEARVTAFDLRFSLTVGEVFADTLAPYIAVRGFGGPILWSGTGIDASGTDKYHFQLGGGALVTAGWFDAYFELVPLGERAATFGVATTF